MKRERLLSAFSLQPRIKSLFRDEMQAMSRGGDAHVYIYRYIQRRSSWRVIKVLSRIFSITTWRALAVLLLQQAGESLYRRALARLV